MEWNFLKTGRIKDILVNGSLLRCGDTYKFEKSRHLLARGSLSQTLLAKSHWTFCALRTLSVNAWSHRSLHWQSDFSMVWRRTRITTILTSRQGNVTLCLDDLNILWWWWSCPTTNGGKARPLILLMVQKIRHSSVEVGSFILLFPGFYRYIPGQDFFHQQYYLFASLTSWKILQEVSGSVEAACGLGLADVPNPACWKRIRSFVEMLIDA